MILVGAALGYSLTEHKAYSATATVLIEPAPSAVSLASQTQPTLGVNDVATQQRIASSARVRAAVEKLIGPVPPVTATTVNASNVITLSAGSRHAARAALVTNTYARTYVKIRDAQVASGLNAAASQLHARLHGITTLIANLERQLSGAQLPPAKSGISSTPTTQALQAELQAALSNEGIVEGQLEAVRVAAASAKGAQVITPASVPSSPSSPKTTRNVGIALALGLLLGFGLALLVDTIDDSIRAKSDIESSIPGVPLLGMIPEIKSRLARKRAIVSMADPDSAVSEAYRGLRTALQFVLLDKELKTVLISSPGVGEGKSATTANLGVAFARAGHRVLIVSADLRRPTIGEMFDCSEDVGLTSIALGTADFDSAVVSVPTVPGLSFLGAGPASPEPAEFLSRPSVGKILRELATMYDIVLLDSAPLLPVADSFGVAAFADAAVLVARNDVTRRRELRRAAERLQTAGTDICGVVLNAVEGSELNDSGYGYYYRGASRYYTKKSRRPTISADGHVTPMSAS